MHGRAVVVRYRARDGAGAARVGVNRGQAPGQARREAQPRAGGGCARPSARSPWPTATTRWRWRAPRRSRSPSTRWRRTCAAPSGGRGCWREAGADRGRAALPRDAGGPLPQQLPLRAELLALRGGGAAAARVAARELADAAAAGALSSRRRPRLRSRARTMSAPCAGSVVSHETIRRPRPDDVSRETGGRADRKEDVCHHARDVPGAKPAAGRRRDGPPRRRLRRRRVHPAARLGRARLRGREPCTSSPSPASWPPCASTSPAASSATAPGPSPTRTSAPRRTSTSAPSTARPSSPPTASSWPPSTAS